MLWSVRAKLLRNTTLRVGVQYLRQNSLPRQECANNHGFFPKKCYYNGGKLKKTDPSLVPKLLQDLQAHFGTALYPFRTRKFFILTKIDP